MKLRNKKTGEVVVEVNKIGLVWNKYGMPADIGQYGSLAELNEEWEDYKPTEPLIKDESIRKAVRAWAYVNCVKEVVYAETFDKCLCNFIDAGIENTSISFVGYVPTLMVGKKYTITELCGEEEE